MPAVGSTASSYLCRARIEDRSLAVRSGFGSVHSAAVRLQSSARPGVAVTFVESAFDGAVLRLDGEGSDVDDEPIDLDQGDRFIVAGHIVIGDSVGVVARYAKTDNRREASLGSDPTAKRDPACGSDRVSGLT